jgi:hypothetical protein
MIKRKSFGLHVKAADDKGVLEAIVSVFGNRDRGGERVVQGAYGKSLQRKLPKGVWAHDWSKPIATTLDARELAPGDALLPDELKELGGLYVKGQFFEEIDDSWQAFLKIKHGLIDEYSIGYSVAQERKGDDGTLELLELDLFEWSPVLVGMNQLTSTLSAKDMRFAEHAEKAIGDLDEFIDRYKGLAEKRGALSTTHHERLKTIHGMVGDLLALAKAPDAKSGNDPEPDTWLEMARQLAGSAN